MLLTKKSRQRNSSLGSLIMAASCLAALFLSACAYSPMEAAAVGQTEPLAKLILSGQIAANERIKIYDVSKTPLCALVASRETQAIAKLLNDGADINKSCYPPDPKSLEDMLPLDVLIRSAAYRFTKTSPYVTGTTYDPAAGQILMNRIAQFIKRGARSYRGQLSYEQVISIVAEQTKSGDEYVAEQKERVAEMKRDSIFSAENLGLVVAAAGGVVNNYAAARSSETVASRLPVAAPQIASPRPTAQAPIAPRVAETIQSPASAPSSIHVDRSERAQIPAGFPKTLSRSWTASGLSKASADGWCARDVQKIRDGFPTSSSTLLRMGSCTCKIDSNAPANSGPGLEKEYFCGFEYVVRQDRPEANAR